MQIAFAIIAALTLVSAMAAMSLRNLVHCALCLALTFAGIAAFYLQLGAAFVGWAQVLVYIGAIAILIVFAILLTRSSEASPQPVLSPVLGRRHRHRRAGFRRADEGHFLQFHRRSICRRRSPTPPSARLAMN